MNIPIFLSVDLKEFGCSRIVPSGEVMSRDLHEAVQGCRELRTWLTQAKELKEYDYC
jgi:hypothetical protein